MKFLNRFRVKTKLLLIAGAFTIPLALVVFLLVRNLQSNITFAEAELAGNEFQRPLEDLVELLPQHGRLTAAEVAAEAAAVAQRIDHAFDELGKLNLRLGAGLGFDAASLAARKRDHIQVSTVRREWDELKAGWTRLDATQRAERHTHLLADVRTMITHVGDMSKLVLDPDLDSYYLMDFTLLAGPQNHERIATVAAEADAILKRKTITPEERSRIAVFAALLKEADGDRIAGSIGSSLNEDANFYGKSAELQAKIPPLLADYSRGAECARRAHESARGGARRHGERAGFCHDRGRGAGVALPAVDRRVDATGRPCSRRDRVV